jgi:hypothetical protein
MKLSEVLDCVGEILSCRNPNVHERLYSRLRESLAEARGSIPEPGEFFAPNEISLFNAGAKIPAIKAARDRTGLSVVDIAEHAQRLYAKKGWVWCKPPYQFKESTC